MILGIGTDLTDVSRIQAVLERFGNKFIQRILSEAEIVLLEQRADKAIFMASRFAAKEAIVKALGTGFTQGIAFNDIIISSNPQGAPEVQYQGQVAAYVASRSIQKTWLSISHEKNYAIAFCVVS